MHDAIADRQGWFLERASTRDVQVPHSADDPEMLTGWRCIPIPPTDDPEWFVVDDSHDRRTTWGRWRRIAGAA